MYKTRILVFWDLKRWCSFSGKIQSQPIIEWHCESSYFKLNKKYNYGEALKKKSVMETAGWEVKIWKLNYKGGPRDNCKI